MKRFTIPGISVFFFLLLPLMGHAQDPVDVSDEIMAVNELFMEAIKSGDVEAIVNLYAENARVLPQGSPLMEGRENIRMMWGAMFAGGPMQLQLKTVSADAFGSTAIEEGEYKILAPDGQAVDHGKYIVIWKKVNGKWLLYQDIWNTSVAPSGM